MSWASTSAIRASPLFYGLLVVEWRISERLDAELQETAALSLNRLELLMQLPLQGRPPPACPTSADALLLLARRRDTARRPRGGGRPRPPRDPRRTTAARPNAVLTDAGQEAAERAYPAYLEIVQRLFHDFVDDDEAEVLVRVWNRVLEANGMTCGPVTHAAEALKSRRVAT